MKYDCCMQVLIMDVSSEDFESPACGCLCKTNQWKLSLLDMVIERDLRPISRSRKQEVEYDRVYPNCRR